MPFLTKMTSFWRNLFRRKQVEQDLDDELQAYVEEMAARGAGPTELGDIDRIKDLVRQQRMGFGKLRPAGATIVMVILAFVSGASAAVGAMRWKAPATSLPVVPQQPELKPRSWEPLQGRLVDQTTGEPIPNAVVSLSPFPASRLDTLTDDTGHFTFLGPVEPRYVLEAGGREWLFQKPHVIPSDKRRTRPDVRIFNRAGEMTGQRIRLSEGTVTIITKEGKRLPLIAGMPSGGLELAVAADKVKRIQYDEGAR
jgi:hypothetical protein